MTCSFVVPVSEFVMRACVCVCPDHTDLSFLPQVKYVLMLNCGAMIDVVETFQPRDHVFFICDRCVTSRVHCASRAASLQQGFHHVSLTS